MEKDPLSLYQLLGQARMSMKAAMPSAYWVIAEISEMRVNHTGHCYLELIDKAEDGEVIRAKVRATIWASTFRMLRSYFETTTRATLGPGIKIMVEVTVEFHELYGFSLNITDIEPSFTIGELAMQKQQVIRRLETEGIYEMNQRLAFPRLPKRIAVISSKTAAGYGDFIDQLAHNSFGYNFNIRLFQTVMQGDEAEQSVVQAFEEIFNQLSSFDVVAMIRGGGSQAELSCFNSYWIASHICQFPLPVLTGIGHERDETVADMVAHTRLKTPTAVAEFLVSKFRAEDDHVNALSDSLIDALSTLLEKKENYINRLTIRLQPAVREQITYHAGQLAGLRLHITDASRQLITRHSLRTGRHASRLLTSVRGMMLSLGHRQILLQKGLRSAGRTCLEGHKNHIGLLEKRNQYLDPFNILERGYSITYCRGKAVRRSEEITPGEILETRLHEGRLKSKRI